ncbi:glycosyltransferase family 2 protein [Aureliella helgolandensis]|uniref:Abequosyltransferase RfbV n=1 Tax=Aureliella helgolandensis TaxID=2527968 RepID=A0A518GHM0_9BACT|nr:glycosyltransferase family 2 protein [Aureliella helgolandensis]QDV28030.1 Abequosyltransferase RfbV [Aureliella helgolandensis]
MSPVLSICIPTFSRAHLLEVCLASLLPQVQALTPVVECVVCDNDSTDSTRQVLDKFSDEFSMRVYRNDSNIGVIGNITRVVAEHARGDYVWVIGDDDVVTAGAVGRIVEFLQAETRLNLLALNVGYLPGDAAPNASAALGGVTEKFSKLLCHHDQTGVLLFDELLEGPCVDFTASYASILRRSLWLEHFPETYTGSPFSSVHSTYLHASIVSSEMPGEIVGYIAEPSIVIYEQPASQFSWAKYHALNTLVHATELLRIYERHGISRKRLHPYYVHQLTRQGDSLGELFWNRAAAGGMVDGFKYLWSAKRYPWLCLKTLGNALTHPAAPTVISAPLRAVRKLWKVLRPSS